MDSHTLLLATRLANGTPLEEALALLRANGATPAEVIRALHVTQGMSLGEAKQVFSQSASWKKEVLAGDALHGEIVSALDKDKGS
jgi:hypothetical protein